VIGIHAVSALTLDRTVEYVETEFRSEKVGPELDGYKMAFVADTHDIGADELKSVVEEISGRGADVLLLGGDHSSKYHGYQSVGILAGADVPDGVYGVEGNHDERGELFGEYAKNGVKAMANSGARLREGLYIGGTEDLWNGTPDFGAAAQGVRPGDLVVALTHNADASMEYDTSTADMILSGHTHGGQITLFGLWAPALSGLTSVTDYGQKFMGGWTEGSSGTSVFVSKGLGTYRGIPRVFARPQVVFVTLKST